MNAYRIQNDIVAARDEQQAIAAWAEEFHRAVGDAGPVEKIDAATFEIDIEDELGGCKVGKVADVMPGDDQPAQVIAFGECEQCG